MKCVHKSCVCSRIYNLNGKLKPDYSATVRASERAHAVNKLF